MGEITEVKNNIEIRFGDIYMSIPRKKEDFATAAKLLELAAERVFGYPEPPSPPTPTIKVLEPTTTSEETKKKSKQKSKDCGETKTKETKTVKRPSYVDLMYNLEYNVDKDNGLVTIYYRPSKRRLKFTYTWVKELFDSLPKEFTVNDIWERARDMGVELTKYECAWLMRVFSYVDFDAEIKREGKRLKAVKMSGGSADGSMNEIKHKLEVEKDTIGTPWSV
jgi:hypothetical protein